MSKERVDKMNKVRWKDTERERERQAKEIPRLYGKRVSSQLVNENV